MGLLECIFAYAVHRWCINAYVTISTHGERKEFPMLDLMQSIKSQMQPFYSGDIRDGAATYLLAVCHNWWGNTNRISEYYFKDFFQHFFCFAVSGCGLPRYQPRSSRVVDGEEASPYSWPWQVGVMVTMCHEECSWVLLYFASTKYCFPQFMD